MNSYVISGLSASPFEHLFGRSDEELAALGVRRYTVDAKPGYPDRIEMRDAEPGETVLLVNYVHHAADNPYRASHAIFVREGATSTYRQVGIIPDVLRIRLLSLRAFDADGMMLDADVVEGAQAEAAIERLLGDPKTAYVHVHYAKRGCYAARIDRA